MKVFHFVLHKPLYSKQNAPRHRNGPIKAIVNGSGQSMPISKQRRNISINHINILLQQSFHWKIGYVQKQKAART